MVLVDTREKKNQHITEWFEGHGIPFQSRALHNGDYSFFVPASPELNIERDLYFDKQVMVERKNSLEELSANFTTGRTRFEEEMATYAGKKYLLVERANYHDIASKRYDTQLSAKAFLASVHTFNIRYGLDIVFMPDRAFSPVWIYGTFTYFLKHYLY